MEPGQEDAPADGAASTGGSEGASDTTGNHLRPNVSPVAAAGQNDAHNLDSDISMSSDSDSESDSDSDKDNGESDTGTGPEPSADAEPQPIQNRAEKIQGGMNTGSKKRKSPGADFHDSGMGEPAAPETHKKVRLDGETEKPSAGNGTVPDKSLLAPEVWHRIFTFCPPKTLGNLLSVNKLFHQYLNPSSSDQIVSPPSAPLGVLSALRPHDIWQSSRRLFWPRMPSPLRSMSELSMWRLLCSTRCQECNKSPSREAETPADNVHNGPGTEGVTLIWPFGIRVCGPCLLQKAVKVRHLICDLAQTRVVVRWPVRLSVLTDR